MPAPDRRMAGRRPPETDSQEDIVLVREIMTRPVVTVTPDTSVADALVLVAQHDLSDLPVVEGQRVVGMVSEIDLIRFAVPLDPRSAT